MSAKKPKAKLFILHSLGNKFLKLLPWLVYLGLVGFYLFSFFDGEALHDFGSFIAAGRALERGDNPYGVYELTSHAEWEGERVYYPNLNPPFSLFFFSQLAEVDPGSAKNAWTWFSIVLFIAALIPLGIIYHVPAAWFGWAIMLAGFWDNLILGQIYVPLFALFAAAWLLFRNGKDIPAAILIGIAAAFKPNLFLVPVILFIAGYRRPAIGVIVTGFSLSLLPVFVYGYQVYLGWYEALLRATWADLPHYISLISLARRIGTPWLGYLLSALMIGLVIGWVWRRKPLLLQALVVALVSAILASPLSTPRFTLLLIPLFYFLLPRPKLWIPAAVLLAPSSILIWLGFQSQALGLALSLLYPAALLFLLWLSIQTEKDTLMKVGI